MEPDLTVIIPTRNEEGNVEEMVRRLTDAFGEPVVIMFVDDSDDGTPAAITDMAATAADDHPVALIHREPGKRVGGLGGAVQAGLRAATTPWVCVMDADLQHPPEVVPALLARARETGADLVVASRRIPGGRSDGLSPARKLVSWGCAALAKALFWTELRGISDPMSGFFLLRREAVVAELAPPGFKILLELVVRHPGWSRNEVPFVFAARRAGRSKGTLREGLRYFRHLWALMRPAQAAADARQMSPAGL